MHTMMIIIIIKSREYKAVKGRFTPYQSKDTTTTAKNGEKWKNIRRQKGSEQLWPIKKHWPCS